MPVKRWPEIFLPCKHGHESPSEAAPGNKVDCRICKHGECPQCGPAGMRVSLWVPASRARTVREAAGHAAPDAPAPAAEPPRTELAGRWQQEQPWNGQLPLTPGRPEDACPECAGPVLWTLGRTLVWCPQCPRAGLPAAVADHYAKQVRRSTEVAVRDAPDSATDRNARVQRRKVAQQMIDGVTGWTDDVFDPAGLDGDALRLALDYRAELEAWVPEIRQAASSGSEADLAAIAASIGELTGRAASSGAIDTIERQRQAIERQRGQAEQRAQWAEEARQQDERDRAELARAERTERQARQVAQPERKAITSGRAMTAIQIHPLGYVAMTLDQMDKKARQDRERKMAEHGPCAYAQHHKEPEVASHRYWITALDSQGNDSGYAIQDTPQIVTCKKHRKLADMWIQDQARALIDQGNTYIRAVQMELT